MAKRTVKIWTLQENALSFAVISTFLEKMEKFTNDNRIIQALPTIKYLVENKARVILMSHLGKVKTEEDKAKNDLRCVADRLSELVDTKLLLYQLQEG